jgi:transcriptional regulator NrdR family protein
MTNNVVEFPSHRIIREASSIPMQEVLRENSMRKMADTITDDLIGNIVEDLENSGIDVDRAEFLKDFSLVADSLRASIYRQFEVEHNLHSFIDTNIKMVSRITGEPVDINDLLDNDETIDTDK